MSVIYGKFELPTKILVDEEEGGNFARFIAEPLEKGFGHTLGNTLRRGMLNSLEAPGIISVKIEGIAHEFMSVEGIIEDMTHIILNFKQALLRRIPTDADRNPRGVEILSKNVEITPQDLEQNGGQYTVTLGDVIDEGLFTVVNPDLPLFSVTKPMSRRIDLKVAIGRGYCPSERHVLKEKVVDEIVIDTTFSPVRVVNYFIENTRVGKDTDFDRLVLEVKTDGRITPKEALSFAVQITMLHMQVFEQLEFMPLVFEEEKEEEGGDYDSLFDKLSLRIGEIELSVRSTNCLLQANVDTIAELVVMPESEMLRFRNFGKKSLNEIKQKLEEMHLHLGMDLSNFGITRENVRQVITDYLNEKLGKEG